MDEEKINQLTITKLICVGSPIEQKNGNILSFFWNWFYHVGLFIFLKDGTVFFTDANERGEKIEIMFKIVTNVEQQIANWSWYYSISPKDVPTLEEVNEYIYEGWNDHWSG